MSAAVSAVVASLAAMTLPQVAQAGGCTTLTSSNGAAQQITSPGCIVVNSGTTIANPGTYNNTIQSNDAIEILTSLSSFTNSGTITAYDYGVLLNGSGNADPVGSVTGLITNNAGGSIQSITIATGASAGGIVNNGTLVSGFSTAAPAGYNGQSTVYNNGHLGFITNNASMSAGANGGWSVYNDAAGVIGAITNNRTMTGTQGYGAVYNGGNITTIVNATHADMSDSGQGQNGGGYGIQNVGGGAISSVSNQGLISGLFGGVYNSGHIGNLTNQSGAIITDSGAGATGQGFGVQNTGGGMLGSLRNAGTVSGQLGGISIDNGSTVNGAILNSGSITGLGSTSVGITVDGSSLVVGGITNSGTIQGGANSVNLQNSSGAFTLTNSGLLQGNAYIGIDTLVLTGTSARVVGNVSDGGSGTVVINGTFTSAGTFNVGTFNVASGGTFNQANAVTVGAGSYNNNGVVNVGSTAQNVTGNYNQASGAEFHLNLVNTTSNYGQLLVSGNAALAAGSIVSVTIPAGLVIANGTVIRDVVQSGATLSASVITVQSNDLFYTLTGSTARDAQELDLVTARNANALANAATANGGASVTGVAAALDTIAGNGVPAAMQPLFNALGTLTPGQVPGALRQLVPVLDGQANQALAETLHTVDRVIQARQEGNLGLSSGDGYLTDGYVWAKAFTTSGAQQSSDGVSGFDAHSGGLALGVDRAFDDRWRGGLAFIYAATGLDQRDVPSTRVDVTTYEIAGYASQNLDATTALNYQIDFGDNENAGERQILLPGYSTHANSSYNGWSVHAGVGIGHTLALGSDSSLTPSLRMDYSRIESDSYSESGAAGLAVASNTYQEAILSGGARFSTTLSAGWKFVGNTSIGYDFLNKKAQASASFVDGGPVFVTEGIKASPWIYRAGFGFVNDISDRTSLSLSYDAEARTSNYFNQTVSVRLRWLF